MASTNNKPIATHIETKNEPDNVPCHSLVIFGSILVHL